MTDDTGSGPIAAGTEPAAPARRFEDLPPAAQRALREAEDRRAAAQAAADVDPRPPEINGRKGPEPVRFGDWEKNGIISDF